MSGSRGLTDVVVVTRGGSKVSEDKVHPSLGQSIPEPALPPMAEDEIPGPPQPGTRASKKMPTLC